MQRCFLYTLSLFKEEPKFVTMVDIDEAVMRSCKEHMRYNIVWLKTYLWLAVEYMTSFAKWFGWRLNYSHFRSACGDVLDKFETEKYKIIADDALKWLATYKWVWNMKVKKFHRSLLVLHMKIDFYDMEFFVLDSDWTKIELTMVVFREEGRQFDVIFGDLTDIPVHGNDTSTWNFVRWTFPQCLVTTSL